MKVFGWSDGHGGVFHYRIKEPLRGLRLLGHQVQTGSALQLKLADVYDTILVRALHNPHESRGWLALAQQGRHLLVYDLDDDVRAWHPTDQSAQYWNEQRRLHAEFHLWGPERHTWLPSIMQWLPPGLAGRIRCHGWQADVPSYYRSLSMDVCLAPLEATPFNETKSAIRIQEHSALGIPVLASPSPAHDGYLVDGVNGYLASSPSAWEKALEAVYRNPTLGEQLGQNGRRLAKAWTTEEQATVRQRILEEAHDERSRTRAGANARAGTKPTRPPTARAIGATTGITTVHAPALRRPADG